MLSSLLLLAILPLAHAHAYVTGDAGQVIVPSIAVVGNETPIFLRLLDQASGEPLTTDDLIVVHERRIHLLIVGEDLTQFIHTHPEDFPTGMEYGYDGQYHVFTTFPKGGTYAVIADYTAKGVATTLTRIVEVPGEPRMAFTEDLARTQQAGEYAITLEAPERIYPGEETAFSFVIGKDGSPVTDLEQYLGADMHALIIDRNLTNASHLHPYVPGHGIHYGSMAQRYSGPRVPFRHTFTGTGVHAIFGQFQRDGQVTTVRFMVRVDPRPAIRWRDATIILAGIGLLAVLLLLWRQGRR